MMTMKFLWRKRKFNLSARLWFKEDTFDRFMYLSRLHDFRAVVKNSGWLLLDRLIRLGISLIVSAWVARYLGPSNFGQLAYVLAYISFFQIFAGLGADGIIVRDLSHNQNPSEILGSAILLRFISSFIAFLTAIVLTFVINPHDYRAIFMIAIVACGIIFQPADVIDLWFQSQLQSKRTVIAKLPGCVIVNLARVYLIHIQAPLMAFALVATLECCLVALGLSAAYKHFRTVSPWTVCVSRVRQILRHSWPFLVSGLSVVVYMRIDQIMLKQFRGESDLGIYAAALPLSQIWQMVPITLATSLAPIVAKKKLANQDEYYDTLLYIFRAFGMVSIFISIMVAFFAPILISFLYGYQYNGAVPVLQILVFSNIFVALGVAQSLWLANENAGLINMMKTGAGAVVAIIGNLVLIPKFGAIGAAIATILSFATSAVLINIVFARDILTMQLGIRVKK